MSGMEIVNELCSILNTEPIPKQLELTILPLEDDNTPLLKEDIYLGIHFPCLPKLSRDFRSIYKSLKNEVVDTGSEHFGDQMMKVLTCLLLVCPDHATAWADRRRIILRKLNQEPQMDDDENLKVLEKELDYLDLLFTQHSKATNAWAYRIWVWKKIAYFYMKNESMHFKPESTEIQSKTLHDVLTKEIRMCNLIAEKYPKNYYCWTYRLNVISHYVEFNRNEFAVKQLMESEINWLTNVWLQQHVSDHSAAHYGGEILRMCLELCTDDSESDNVSWHLRYLSKIMWNGDNSCKFYVEKFPSNEVVWIWRRICSRLLLECLSKRMHGISKEEYLQFVTEFVNKEILSILKRFCVTSCAHDHASLYAKKYVSWNLKHIQKFRIEIGNNCQEIMDLFDVSEESHNVLHKYWVGNVEKFFKVNRKTVAHKRIMNE